MKKFLENMTWPNTMTFNNSSTGKLKFSGSADVDHIRPNPSKVFAILQLSSEQIECLDVKFSKDEAELQKQHFVDLHKNGEKFFVVEIKQLKDQGSCDPCESWDS